jgi:hypothetical protein
LISIQTSFDEFNDPCLKRVKNKVLK